MKSDEWKRGALAPNQAGVKCLECDWEYVIDENDSWNCPNCGRGGDQFVVLKTGRE